MSQPNDSLGLVYIHQILADLRTDDLDVLADLAFERKEAMREGMNPPSHQPDETFALSRLSH